MNFSQAHEPVRRKAKKGFFTNKAVKGRGDDF